MGEYYWIVARAILSKGAIIPNGCIMGASSFLNKAYLEWVHITAVISRKIVKRNIRWKYNGGESY